MFEVIVILAVGFVAIFAIAVIAGAGKGIKEAYDENKEISEYLDSK